MFGRGEKIKDKQVIDNLQRVSVVGDESFTDWFDIKELPCVFKETSRYTLFVEH